MGNGQSLGSDLSQEEKEAVLHGETTMQSIANTLKSGRLSNVIVIAGAGLSVSAGIPDFRSPGTGLYSKLDQYGLPYPEAVFDIEFFRRNPRPFFELAKELHPGKLGLEPTLAHFFVVLLSRKGMLRRMYTQNIDTLERLAGLPAERLVEAHGSFASASCTRCDAQYDAQWMERAVRLDPQEDVDIVPRCEVCGAGAPVKPDITFFGEELPHRFKQLAAADMAAADMCIVMGSSLQVAPVSGLFMQVPPACPRVLVNLESAGEALDMGSEEQLQGLTQEQLATLLSSDGDGGFRFNLADNYRDVFLQGTCDEQVRLLARAAGWEEELLQLQQEQLQQLRRARATERAAPVRTSTVPGASASAGPPAEGTPTGTVPGASSPEGPPVEGTPRNGLQDGNQDNSNVGALSLQQALEGAGAAAVRAAGAAQGSAEASAAAAAGEAAADAAWAAGGMSVLDDAEALFAARGQTEVADASAEGGNGTAAPAEGAGGAGGAQPHTQHAAQ